MCGGFLNDCGGGGGGIGAEACFGVGSGGRLKWQVDDYRFGERLLSKVGELRRVEWAECVVASDL